MVEHCNIRHILTIDGLARILSHLTFQTLQYTMLYASVTLRLACPYPKVCVSLPCTLRIVILRSVHRYVYSISISHQPVV